MLKKSSEKLKSNIAIEYFDTTGITGSVADKICTYYNANPNWRDRQVTIPGLQPIILQSVQREGENCFGTLVILKDGKQLTTYNDGRHERLVSSGKSISSFFTFYYADELKVFVVHKWREGGGKSDIQSFLRRKCDLPNLSLWGILSKEGVDKLTGAKEPVSVTLRVSIPPKLSMFAHDEGDIDQTIYKIRKELRNIGHLVNAEEFEVKLKSTKRNGFLNIEKVKDFIYSSREKLGSELKSVRMDAKFPEVPITDDNYDPKAEEYKDKVEELLTDRARSNTDVEYDDVIDSDPERVYQEFYDKLKEFYGRNKNYIIAYQGRKNKRH